MSDIADSLGKYYFQTAYVVTDLDRAEQWFTKILGVPLWARSTVELGETCRFRGGPSDSAMNIALGFAGEVQIELIQPTRGTSIYTEFLDAGRNGLHHIAFVVPHYDEVVAMFRDRDCELLADGILSGGQVRFSYFDCGAEEASVIEILDFAPETRAAMADLKRQCAEQAARP